MGPKVSLTGNIDDCTLALRLGIAVNALEASQRFYLFVKDADGPAGDRDRLWAFLVAVGFIHEAIQLLRSHFPRVRNLARVGGADDETLMSASQLLGGNLSVSRPISRMRNKLIFHWDDNVIRTYVTKFSSDRVTWASGVGDTQGETVFTAAADALINSVLPDEPGADAERDAVRLKAFVNDIPPTTKLLIQLFQQAIMGHWRSYDMRTEHAS
ncbi:MAG: hypothetical protein H8K03_10400 [Nitrospira sp.]